MREDNPENSDKKNGSRRTFLQTLSTTSIASLFSGSALAASSQNAKRDAPQPYSKKGTDGNKPDSDVYLKHINELPAVRRAVSEFESKGDPSALFGHDFADLVSQLSPTDTVNITVNTLGEKKSLKSKGDRGRNIHGWRPTNEEVNYLSQFGNLTYSSDVISTKVCIRDVEVRQLPKIANHEGVVEINHMIDSISPNYLDVDNIENNGYTYFEGANNEFYIDDEYIGIIEAGYDTSKGMFSTNYAEEVGISGYAHDFTSDDDWSTITDEDFGGHSTNVADIAARMIMGSSQSNVIVPYKVVNDSTNMGESGADENIRSAIETALINDIPVINMSFNVRGPTGQEDYCTSIFCEELDSYTSAGYVPTAAVANEDRNGGPYHYPASSWLTIGVGNAAEKTDYYEVRAADDSEFGDVTYYENGTTYCSWCHNASGTDSNFVPRIYGFGEIDGDYYNEGGSSYGAPQAAAAAAVGIDCGTIDSYDEAVHQFENMNRFDVHSNDSADPSRLGDVVDAEAVDSS